MSNLERCDSCHGTKTIKGIGMIDKPCDPCKGIGWIEKSVSNETKSEVEKPVVEVKKKGGRRKKADI